MTEPWKSANAEGLAFAAEGNWHSAAQAFQDSLEALERLLNEHGVTRAAYDDARARILLNIGQCYFHVRDWAEARRYAERSCAIRVGLYGEDSLVVARTRGDLAVIVGAAGYHDESMSLLDRAVSSVERKGGEQSEHLIPLLGNAARLLARRAPGLAAPYINRLDAVQSALRARELDARISPSAVPEHTFEGGPLSSGSDDHLLRSAIAQTADLLRTTPSANTALSANDAAAARDKGASIAVSGDRVRDDAEPRATVRPAAALDDAVFDLVEPPPPTLSALPAPSKEAGAVNPLGFDVQYGIPPQLHAPLESTDTVSLDVVRPALIMPEPRVSPRKFGGDRRGSTRVASNNNVLYVAAVVALAAGAAVYMFITR